MKRGLHLRAVFDDSLVDRGMIDADTPLEHEFFDMTRAQRIGQIPADPDQNDLLGEMGTFEAHGHGCSPSLFIVDNRRGSYLKVPQIKNCDKTWSQYEAPSHSGEMGLSYSIFGSVRANNISALAQDHMGHLWVGIVHGHLQ
jgi:hypothetical protein